VIIPMDHGVTLGPIKGLESLAELIDKVSYNGVNAVLGHMILPLHGFIDGFNDLGLILHLSAGTIWSRHPNIKVLVNSVEMAVKMGADGVSVHINIGNEHEEQMIDDLHKVSSQCSKWGMPLLAMIYPRGNRVKSEYDEERITRSVCIGAEAGADIVKVNYTGSIDTFRRVVESCSIPVVIAGGKATRPEEVLTAVKESLEVGSAGVSIGRNVFQSPNSTKMIKAISAIVHENVTVRDAMELLKR